LREARDSMGESERKDDRKTRVKDLAEEEPGARIDLGEVNLESKEEKGIEPREEQHDEPSAGARETDMLAGLAEELKALRAERDRRYDAWLRTTADYDNYRKRTEREREEFQHYELESLLHQMLPVLGNCERALEHIPPDAPRAFVEGVTLIYKQLQDVLSKQGLVEIEAAGEMFDPRVHEAVETEACEDAPHHQVLRVVQKGYRLGRRVLRPALVKVCVHPEEMDIELKEDGGEGEARS